MRYVAETVIVVAGATLLFLVIYVAGYMGLF